MPTSRRISANATAPDSARTQMAASVRARERTTNHQRKDPIRSGSVTMLRRVERVVLERRRPVRPRALDDLPRGLDDLRLNVLGVGVISPPPRRVDQAGVRNASPLVDEAPDLAVRGPGPPNCPTPRSPDTDDDRQRVLSEACVGGAVHVAVRQADLAPDLTPSHFTGERLMATLVAASRS